MRGVPSVGDLQDRLARWAEACLSCDLADREAAEEGVRLAYRSGGLDPPAKIVWCSGPLQIATALAGASPSRSIGGSVRAAIYDAVRDKAAAIAAWTYGLTEAQYAQLDLRT